MSDILEKLEKGTRNPSLPLFTPLPDSVHVRKIIKAGFVRYPRKIGKGHKKPVFAFVYTITGQCSSQKNYQSWFC